ncbi:bacterial alpha-L-rhamnosidase-domain-containing protein [Aspergillus pseudoustus]|uniref:alpha-L-rhamnosidase n=1 Tax=Aspergillus pseudoustus TaxID=1810923 RepID=A0ABR4IRJ5_9EURO
MSAVPVLSSPSFEHHPTGFGLGHSHPRLSWRFLPTDDGKHPKDWKQSSYELELTPMGGAPEVFPVESAESVLVPRPAKKLQPSEMANVRAAEFIGAADPFQTTRESLRPIQLQRGFDLPTNRGALLKARLYITALGVYEARLNGVRIGQDVLAPGWTSYHHRLIYQTYNLTQLLLSGNNVLSVEVAEGWYAGRLGFGGGRRYIYGDEVGLLAQLVTFEENEIWRLSSDSSWLCQTFCVVQSEIYNGEAHDLRVTDGTWSPVKTLNVALHALTATDAPPIRITEKVMPAQILRSTSGKIVLDFGQNLVGGLRINSPLHLPAGSLLTLVYAEVLENGEIATRPLRRAKCTDRIVFGDDVITSWQTKFTFHGFRYVQVDGWPGIPTVHDFTALRDERLGWTGDIQVFAPVAMFLYDSVSMLSGWLEDLSVDQLSTEHGIPGLVVPEMLWDHWCKPSPQAVWHDAAVLTPWDAYVASSDIEILRRQYPSMKVWMTKGIRRGEDGLWDGNVWQLGDWLDPNAPPEDAGNGSVISSVLGYEDDAAFYLNDAHMLRRRFQDKYLTPSGLLASDTQTAAARLGDLVRASKFHISTGFVGTALICHALTHSNQTQLAYRMLLEKHCPSWLYPITMGATTTWERWDSMLPDGRVNEGGMTSFNHYALGAVASWLHGSVAGISTRDGWKTVQVAPKPGGSLTSAEAAFEGPYGLVKCAWSLHENEFVLDLTIPPNCMASLSDAALLELFNPPQKTRPNLPQPSLGWGGLRA